jgi:ribosomal protein L22
MKAELVLLMNSIRNESRVYKRDMLKFQNEMFPQLNHTHNNGYREQLKVLQHIQENSEANKGLAKETKTRWSKCLKSRKKLLKENS